MKNHIIKLLKSKSLYLLLSSLLLIGYLFQSIQPSFSNLTLTTPSGKSQTLESLGFMESTESGVYRLTGTLTATKQSSAILRIIPDDEVYALNINEQSIDLNIIPHEQRKDYSKGFIYDLSGHIKEGDNKIEIFYYDRGGLMGIVISAEPGKRTVQFLYLLITFIALLFSIKLLDLFKISTPVRVLFIGALLIRIAYFSVTPSDVRDHDMGDHIGYTEYLSKNWTLPPVDYAVGGAFFHPPLYYYTGAVVYKVTQLIEPNNKVIIYRVQQILSLCYGMGFVLFGLLILQELLNRYRTPADQNSDSTHADEEQIHQATAYLAKIYNTLKNDNLFWVIGALFAFWPVAIVHSVRIGNDPMLYFLVSASLYYIIRWYRYDLQKDLIISSIIGAAAVLTKANGEILIAVLGVIGLYKMIKTKNWVYYFKIAIAPCLIMLFAVAITVGPALILKMQGKRDKLYIDNLDNISTANLVGNTAANYLWFDAKIFITEPYSDPYDDRMGRQYFWNYIGKTGIIGEFKYPKAISINTTTICSFLAMIMFIYTIAGIYHMRKTDFKEMAPILLSGFFFWAGVTYMRMTFPANIDFRYIVPILITICALYAVSILSFERTGALRMANIGKALSLLFTFTGIVFILTI